MLSFLTRNSASSLFVAIAMAVLGVSPSMAFASTLSFNPASGSFTAGKTFTVKVVVDPAGQSVNATDGTITFDASLLSVSAVSKEGSVFSLWTADPSYSNTGGTISFSGGTPSPFSTRGTIIAITFKAKKAGTTALSFAKGSILAADGKGTNVYTPGDGASLTITDAPAAAPVDVAADSAPDAAVSADGIGTPPPAPVITSSTHPKPDGWYATSTAIFSWKPPADVTSVRTGFSDKPDASPDQVQKISTTTFTMTGIKDGTWYFAAQYKNDGGWGPAARLKVNIDSVPPAEFEVALATPSSSTDAPKLSFKTDDELSGMDRYEVFFGTTAMGTVRAKDIADGSYLIPPQPGGEQDVKVKAYDKAGNVREAVRHLTIPAVAKPAAQDSATPAPQGSNTIEHIVVVIFAITCGAMFAWNMRSKKEREADRARILSRVLEMREKNDRIFTAMREEFEELVQGLDEKPQLTPAERQFLESIKEVLEISEGLVDSGIEELKKEVRGK